MVLLLETLLSLSILIIVIMYVDKKIDRKTKFGKWWNKHISQAIDPNDTNF